MLQWVCLGKSDVHVKKCCQRLGRHVTEWQVVLNHVPFAHENLAIVTIIIMHYLPPLTIHTYGPQAEWAWKEDTFWIVPRALFSWWKLQLLNCKYCPCRGHFFRGTSLSMFYFLCSRAIWPPTQHDLSTQFVIPKLQSCLFYCTVPEYPSDLGLAQITTCGCQLKIFSTSSCHFWCTPRFSALGPLLFLIDVNGAANKSLNSGSLLLYADDILFLLSQLRTERLSSTKISGHPPVMVATKLYAAKGIKM